MRHALAGRSPSRFAGVAGDEADLDHLFRPLGIVVTATWRRAVVLLPLMDHLVNESPHHVLKFPAQAVRVEANLVDLFLATTPSLRREEPEAAPMP